MNFARALLDAFRGYAIRREAWDGARYLIADMENSQLMRYNEGDKEGITFTVTQFEIFADDWESFKHPNHRRRVTGSNKKVSEEHVRTEATAEPADTTE